MGRQRARYASEVRLVLWNLDLVFVTVEGRMRFLV